MAYLMSWKIEKIYSGWSKNLNSKKIPQTIKVNKTKHGRIYINNYREGFFKYNIKKERKATFRELQNARVLEDNQSPHFVGQ